MLTVGQLRKVIEGMPDAAPVIPYLMGYGGIIPDGVGLVAAGVDSSADLPALFICVEARSDEDGDDEDDPC